MSKTITTERGDMHLSCNYQPRDLFTLVDLSFKDREQFDYANSEEECHDERYFRYRGSWYDLTQFDIASDQIKALGFDGMMAQSMFDAVLARYFRDDGNEFDGQVVIAHLYR